MKSTSDEHDDVISAYIRVIEHESPEVAAAIEEIRSLCGSRAALRATSILALVKTEFEENRVTPDVRSHSELIGEFPGARPMLEYALTCFLLALRATRDQRLSRDHESGSSTFEFSSIQPITAPYRGVYVPPQAIRSAPERSRP